MNLSSHPFVGILVVLTSAVGVSACGNSDSGGGGSATTSSGTGAGGSGGSAAGGSTGGATSGTGATTGAGAGGAASGGSTSGTGATAGAGGGSGGSGGAPETPLYLVSIDHWKNPSGLRKIDIATGIGKEVCTLPAGPDGVDDVNYHSSTFSRDGILYASNSKTGSIDKIDPCTCAVIAGGPTGFGSLPGITANKSNGLYGLETSPDDLLVNINPMDLVGSLVGYLGVDFVNAGATWSDTANGGQGGIYAINSGDNSLYTIDPMSGAATKVIPITGVPFNSVGIEMHPANGVIYACTNDMVLHSIDPVTGVASSIGPGMGHTQTCNNLAAPWTKIACLDSF